MLKPHPVGGLDMTADPGDRRYDVIGTCAP
jgi:hypothetical protein